MPLISHGGAASLAPPNTIEGVIVAETFRPAYIEVDINYTVDDVLVMYHGSVLRFLQGKKTKETFSALAQKYPGLIQFEEFIKYIPSSPYLFDIKFVDHQALNHMITLLKDSKQRGFGFTSPHEYSLRTMHQAFPEALILQSQPYHHGPIAALELARKNNFNGVMLNKWWLSPFFYNICRLHRKTIGIYTIDSAWGIWMSQRFFPSAYIITNRPDTYRKIFPS